MTIGENIRRLRKARGLTIKQLANLLGVSESYVRAYETGRRNPKESSLQKIADVLCVNVEVLKNSNLNGVSALHKLFQMYRNYDGILFTTPDENGNDRIAIRFDSFPLMVSWYWRYVSYEEEVNKALKIKNQKDRKIALYEAERSFDMWMDQYPLTEPDPQFLKAQEAHDKFLDYIGLHPKNED